MSFRYFEIHVVGRFNAICAVFRLDQGDAAVLAELGAFKQYFGFAIWASVHGNLPVVLIGLFSGIIDHWGDFFKWSTPMTRL
jgi:hypothetical protein